MKKCVAIFLSVFLFSLFGPGAYAELPNDWEEIIGGVVFIGDSYCTGANEKNDGKRHQDEAWAQMTANALELKNYAIACEGGTGLAREKDGKSFIDLLDEGVKKIPNPNSVRWIFVMGGYNDRTESYDKILKSGIEFVEHAHEVFPNAKIDFGMVGYDAKRAERQKKLDDVVTPAWKEVAERTGQTYEGTPEEILKQQSDLMSNDGFHPNAEGQYAIEQLPEQFLKQQYYDAVQVRNKEQEKSTFEEKNKKRQTTVQVTPVIISILIIAIGLVIVIKNITEQRKDQKKV